MHSNDSFRFLQAVTPDRAGLVEERDLPEPLPYGLQPRHVLRAIEDVQDLIHQMNAVLYESSYEPLEDLMDRASFSGLISRTVTTRLAEARSGSLVVNQYHNGYPDLIPKGRYPSDSVQRGVGLEVKASRSDGSWQAHGPRPGWFVVVQFSIDETEGIARLERKPTQIRAAMIARLTEDDWSWTPARSGRIRSGTASVKPSGRLKLRKGAVWVDPDYRVEHDALQRSLLLTNFRNTIGRDVQSVLANNNEPMTTKQIAESLEAPAGITDSETLAAVRSTLPRLRREGVVATAQQRGRYRLVDGSGL